jgi:hypothetical protein
VKPGPGGKSVLGGGGLARFGFAAGFLQLQSALCDEKFVGREVLGFDVRLELEALSEKTLHHLAELIAGGSFRDIDVDVEAVLVYRGLTRDLKVLDVPGDGDKILEGRRAKAVVGGVFRPGAALTAADALRAGGFDGGDLELADCD